MIPVTTSGVASASFMDNAKTLPEVVAIPFPLFAADGVLPTDDDATLCFLRHCGDLCPSSPQEKHLTEKSCLVP